MNFRQGEPTLEEMLSDPIVRAVMEADGVDPQELAATLRQTGRMLARDTRGRCPRTSISLATMQRGSPALPGRRRRSGHGLNGARHYLQRQM